MARKKVTSVPALADWGAVDNALRDIRECQHTLAEMAVQRDRQIDSIKADYAQGALPLQNRVKALESEVKAYVDLHRAELDGKSRALNFGTVGYRVSSKLMLASSRVAEAIATLKVLGHAELIKTTETLDREALKRQPGDILQQVGAYIRTVDEFYSLSVSSVCRYAQGYVENLQTLQIAQANFRNMLDELERYPDLDTTEALVRVASQNLMTALTSKKDEDWSAVSVDKLMNQISGLTRAVAYKKRVELQNKSDIEAGTGDLKSALWSAMAKERPDLYKQVSAYLDRKAQEGGT